MSQEAGHEVGDAEAREEELGFGGPFREEWKPLSPDWFPLV